MDTVELVGRLLVSLAVVIGLLWLVARRARRGGRRRIRSGRLIDVLGRQQLSRSASVAVVRVLDRALIVGISDSAISVLGDLELDAVHAGLAELDPPRAVDSPRTAHRRSAPPTVATTVGAPATAAPPEPDHIAAPAFSTHPGRNTGPLAGSALSPATWRQTVDALREMTVRRG